jgi:superfamily II DNA or RNA helicase
MSREAIGRKILASIPKQKMVRLHLAPRFGKTKLIISLIERDRPKSILWVTPSRKLADIDIPQEFRKWNAEIYLDSLYLTTWASLKNIKGHYDLIILDEEQNVTENNCQNLLNTTLTGNIVSMTGTPPSSEEKQEIYWKLGLSISYTLTIDEAVKLGIVSDYKITIFNIDLSSKQDIEIAKGKSKFLTSELSSYEYIDQKAKSAYNSFSPNSKFPWAIAKRVEFIKKSKTKKELAKRVLKKLCSGRTLIFAPFINYAEELCEHSYHSKSANKDSLDNFQNFKINRLSLVNTGGVGFTFKGIENLLIVQMDSNKTGLSTQKIARALLKQKSKEKVNIYILCLRNTKDVEWVSKGISDFEPSRIRMVKATLT